MDKIPATYREMLDCKACLDSGTEKGMGSLVVLLLAERAR
jgi:hypothetical protein